MAPWDEPALGEAVRAVQSDPAHHLRVGEVLWSAAHFPDAGVGLPPACTEVVGYARQPMPDLGIEAFAGSGVEPRGLQQLSVRVQLMLCGRGVAHPDRP